MTEIAEKKKLTLKEKRQLTNKYKTAGQPRAFSEDEFIQLYEEFLLYIKALNYSMVPTISTFHWYLKEYKSIKVDYRTIRLTIHEYYPNMKKDYISMLSDVLNEGSMLGKYQQAAAIFALKNWCKWTDKQEIAADTTIKIELSDSLADWSK